MSMYELENASMNKSKKLTRNNIKARDMVRSSTFCHAEMTSETLDLAWTSNFGEVIRDEYEYKKSSHFLT